jgi:hypothetical protein
MKLVKYLVQSNLREILIKVSSMSLHIEYKFVQILLFEIKIFCISWVVRCDILLRF